jgi:hypothetical protein
VDLWRQAERERSSAKRMSTYAALSANGAMFAQMQTNAAVAAQWKKVEEMEEAALQLFAVEQQRATDPGGGVTGVVGMGIGAAAGWTPPAALDAVADSRYQEEPPISMF